MRFFNLDLHVSIIEDIKNIFQEIGHVVENWSISGHTWVFGKNRDRVDVVNEDTWPRLDQKMCDAFYSRYKDELKHYDGFIAAYPLCFALLYEKFNKPIITLVATRYEHPFSNDLHRREWFNKKLKSMVNSGQIIPLTNNKYDQFYCEHFTDFKWKHIPSICNYTQETYNPTKNKSIVSARKHSSLSLDGCWWSDEECDNLRDIGRHTWSQLYSYNSIIHMPYNVSIMSIFEQYSANVPLFFPTLNFGLSDSSFLEELLFSSTLMTDEDKQIIKSRENLKLSDFYDEQWMPHINLFNSLDELRELIETVDFNNVSNNMKTFNEIRKRDVINLWEEVLCRIK